MIRFVSILGMIIVATAALVSLPACEGAGDGAGEGEGE